MKKRIAPPADSRRTQLIITATVIAQHGQVPPGTHIPVLRVEPKFMSSELQAYGGPFSISLPDMATFDAFLHCENPAHRDQVAQLF